MRVLNCLVNELIVGVKTSVVIGVHCPVGRLDLSVLHGKCFF